MITKRNHPVLLQNGNFLPAAEERAALALQQSGMDLQAAKQGTMAYGILKQHDISTQEGKLRIRFDAMASHDITYVGIIQTARASGLKEFPIPYVLTNCHNSLCAVGGTINEDDHMFGLTAAKKYGGIYVPAHGAVIHQYMREACAACGKMILGSDSHTRYGALGTMSVGEGGPELVKQLLGQTYDINTPDVVAVRLTGKPRPGVGPQDVALAIIGATFSDGFVKNSVMEFVGDGIANLSMDFRIGVDVMTTETTCLSSIWQTDEKTKAYLTTHGRPEAYAALAPQEFAYYDRAVEVDLSQVEPMIAMPFHPSNVYTVQQVCDNAGDILRDVERKAQAQLEGETKIHLTDKLVDGKIDTQQGIVAGCAGGTYENICDIADILRGRSIGDGAFNLSVYPASQPINAALMQNGAYAALQASGAVIKTAFCGPCFGAGDVPANNAFSIRHTTRNFPSREGSKPGEGQIAAVALMDARSIAASAANGGVLTPATALDVTYQNPPYTYDDSYYRTRVYAGFGKADAAQELQLGPNIRNWPEFSALTKNLLLQVVSVIDDPVTTTDELIPSGETSSYRSNPERLAEFALSRKDPEYVGRAKEVRAVETSRKDGTAVTDAAIRNALDAMQADEKTTGIGSVIFAVKPGDGSAREQAASCQKVLGGWANIANEYATKRYRSNLINWGMLPLLTDWEARQFQVGDCIYIPDVRKAIADGKDAIAAMWIRDAQTKEITFNLGGLTTTEREIILAGCLMNNNRIRNKEEQA